MIIKTSDFITSAADSKGFFRDNRPQIAVAGKSNVGKSSFINFIAGRNKLARVSVTPGRTRLINYFDMGEFILTDLPGYGYAEVAKEKKEGWGRLIETYLLSEPNLKRVILLVDIRHPPTPQDLQLIDFLNYHTIPFNVIATKADKIARTKVKGRLMEIAADLKMGIDNLLAVSSQAKTGKEEVLNFIGQLLDLT